MWAMRAGAIAASVLVGCGFSPHAVDDGRIDVAPGDALHDAHPDVSPDAWLPGYMYRKAITVTPQLAAPLANFPLGLVRTMDHDLMDHLHGDQLAVTSDDAVTPLDVEHVSTMGGNLELWVRVPMLQPGPQTLYLYYSGPTTQSSRAMWAGATGVWHLSEGGPTVHDSSPMPHDLSQVNGNQNPMSKPGIAGNARSYDGQDDSLGIADPVDGLLDEGMQSFSFSMWLKVPPGATASFGTPLWKGGTSTSEPGFCVLTGATWNVKIHDGTSYIDPELGTATTLGTDWVHVAGVVDRGAAQFSAYANGTPTQTLPIPVGFGSLDNTFAFDIGRAGSGPFKGLVDEVRIYPDVRSADWIKTENANLADDAFIEFGDEKTQP